MRSILLGATILTFAGCREGFTANCQDGHEGCPCTEQSSCLEGLVCLSETCVQETGDAGTSGASTSQSGSGAGETAGTEDGASTSSGDTDGDLEELNDDFEGQPLDPSWQFLNEERAAWSLESGSFMLEPIDNSVWYDGSEGILVWKAVSGDFRVTAPITVDRPSTPGTPPTQPISFAGLMVRDGITSFESYVAVLLGLDMASEYVIEGKTTEQSVTMLNGTPALGGAQLRICRIESDVEVLAHDTEVWQLLYTYDRPDLPQTLDVGMVAYCDNSNADMRGAFEKIEFARVSDPSDCLVD